MTQHEEDDARAQRGQHSDDLRREGNSRAVWVLVPQHKFEV